MGEVSVRKSDDGFNNVGVEQGSSLLENSNEEQIIMAVHNNLNFAPDSPLYFKQLMGATQINVDFNPYNDSMKILSSELMTGQSKDNEITQLKSNQGSENTFKDRKVFFQNKKNTEIQPKSNVKSPLMVSGKPIHEQLSQQALTSMEIDSKNGTLSGIPRFNAN